MSLSRVLFAIALCVISSVTMRADSPASGKSSSPFDGKTTAGWKPKDEKKNHWMVGVSSLDPTNPGKIILKDGSGELVNAATGGTDISTEAKYGDCTIEVEFMVPKGSNSGIYVMGEYEVQVLDSFGKPNDKLTQGDLGALYSAAAPKVNAAKKPGEWQKFVIEFQAPKFDGDKKTAKAKFVKVTLNDVVLHENVEMEKATPGGLTGKEAATGPLMFQGDHGPVAFRNIKVTAK
ncbi:3-keto-disaccharide hydrolase [Zavarzinella formosa]|uniref:3-keto-disaccharide hydrolase n=1 Tax=Zavarzinella formosa TaxID=360055 RepID=UPI00030915FB|nr:DUF1080 domain-containing protein [Zavarzinella formosa]